MQLAIGRIYKEGKRPRMIPVALAMGVVHDQMRRGEFPDVGDGGFEPLLFGDHVHVSHEGAFLVEACWFAALYGQSPEGKFLPLRTRLTAPQAAAMQRLAWDVVKNYPDSGLYEEGTMPCGRPQFSPQAFPHQSGHPGYPLLRDARLLVPVYTRWD